MRFLALVFFHTVLCDIRCMTRDKEPPAIWREIGSRVRHFRRSQGKSVDWLAEAVGLQRVQIVRIEAGLVGTTLERLDRIANVLGVKMSDLMPPPDVAEKSDLEVGFRGRGLSEQEIKRILEFIELIEKARPE